MVRTPPRESDPATARAATQSSRQNAWKSSIAPTAAHPHQHGCSSRNARSSAITAATFPDLAFSDSNSIASFRSAPAHAHPPRPRSISAQKPTATRSHEPHRANRLLRTQPHLQDAQFFHCITSKSRWSQKSKNATQTLKTNGARGGLAKGHVTMIQPRSRPAPPLRVTSEHVVCRAGMLRSAVGVRAERPQPLSREGTAALGLADALVSRRAVRPVSWAARLVRLRPQGRRAASRRSTGAPRLTLWRRRAP